MSRMTPTILFAAIAAASLMAGPGVQAAERDTEAHKKVVDASGVIKMNQLLCKDIVRFTGQDRVIALSILHGYYLGKKGATEFVDGTLAQTADDFIEYCLDHPNAKMLETFGKFAK